MNNPTTLDLEHREALLDEWVATRREIARLEARASTLLAERMRLCAADANAFSTHRESIYRSMIAEYSAASHLSKGSIEFAFDDATAVADRFPAVHAALSEGTISAHHLREIVRAGAIVTDAVREGRVSAEVHSLYEAAALVVAEQDTPARTRAHARQVAAALAQQSVLERHAGAGAERTVTLRSLDDGLALLTVVLPEVLGVAIYDRLTRMSRQIVRNRAENPSMPTAVSPAPFPASVDDADVPEEADETERLRELESIDIEDLTIPSHIPDWVLADVVAHTRDSRTFDQIRTDLLVDMLLASEPSAVLGTGLDRITAHVQVTVAATTLAHLDERLAELDGHGTLHPDIARDIAGRSGGWTRLFLDTDGMIVETDAYSPTDAMKRFLRARDQHCRFPGCRVPVARCDIDHNHDHALGGATRTDNLTHLCRGHHTLKHPDLREEDRWKAHLSPDGSVMWQSPLGRRYRDRPERRVMFV